MRILGCDGLQLFVPADRLQEAHDFYCLYLGIPETSKIPKGPGFALAVPGTTVEVLPCAPTETGEAKGTGCGLILEVEDLDAWEIQLQDIGQKPKALPYVTGLRRLTFPDGFGNSVEFRERIPYEV